MSLNCNRGYILVEMLVSLSILFTICFFMVPNYLLIMNERKSMELVNIANTFLMEELHAYMFEGREKENKMMIQLDTEFHLVWRYNDKIQLDEACISWRDQRNRERKRCGYGKK